jgi:hypothetical protein
VSLVETPQLLEELIMLILTRSEEMSQLKHQYADNNQESRLVFTIHSDHQILPRGDRPEGLVATFQFIRGKAKTIRTKTATVKTAMNR